MKHFTYGQAVFVLVAGLVVILFLLAAHGMGFVK